jgi:tetratricopeptide (TPR) repeat protein
MASKRSKGGGKSTLNSPSLRQEAERLIEKGRFKDAVKQAKLCFRDQPTDELRRLLERAYFLRAEQLQCEGMPESAREVSQHLLEFGLTDPALLEPTVELLLKVGMVREAIPLRDRVRDPAAVERFARQAADQAVLQPERIPDSFAELREGGLLIRRALEALEAGNPEQALIELREVSRGSPLSDWKLFVRGLAAFQRGDFPEAQVNWERLEPGRAPARIARSLKWLEDTTSQGSSGGSEVPDTSQLERLIFGEPILAPLRTLRSKLAEQDWLGVFDELGPLRFALRNLDPRLAHRLTKNLYHVLVDFVEELDFAQMTYYVNRFTQVAEPLPIDPKWNRFHALVWEGPCGDQSEAEDFWREYLVELDSVAALQPEERPIAKALVLNHVGRAYFDEVESPSPRFPFALFSKNEQVDSKKRGIACLEEAARLYPALGSSYKALVAAHAEWDEWDKAAEVARRWLEACPNEFDALAFLVRHHLRAAEPQAALPYLERARALKPLEKGYLNLESTVRVGIARHLALEGRFDEGRAQLDVAEQMSPGKRDFAILARRAVLELKAGEPLRSQQFINEAVDLLPDAMPLWLTLEIEAIRYELPEFERERFAAKFRAGLERRRRSETVGALAELMVAHQALTRKYEGFEKHLAQVVDFIRPTTRLSYRADDLLAVCKLLAALPGETSLLTKLVKRGFKLFPEHPYFLLMEATCELDKKPFRAHAKRARELLEKALDRAQASTDGQDAELVELIKKSLACARHVESHGAGLPFPSYDDPEGISFADLEALTQTLATMMGSEPFDFDEDEYEDEDEELNESHFEPLPARPGKKHNRSKR